MTRCCAGNGFCHDDHAVLLHALGDRVGEIRLDQHQHAGQGVLAGVGCKFVTEFIGQRRIDDDEIDIVFDEPAPRFAAGGGGENAVRMPAAAVNQVDQNVCAFFGCGYE